MQNRANRRVRNRVLRYFKGLAVARADWRTYWRTIGTAAERPVHAACMAVAERPNGVGKAAATLAAGPQERARCQLARLSARKCRQ